MHFSPFSVWNDKGRFWLYCLLAAHRLGHRRPAPYGLGRAGGELFLLKRVNRERFERCAPASSARSSWP
jgi:hypothetical protein